VVSDTLLKTGGGFGTEITLKAEVADGEEEILDRLSVSVGVTAKRNYLDRAISQTRNLRSSIPDASSGSGNPGRGGGSPAGKGNQGSARGVNGLRNKLDGIEKRLVSIKEKTDGSGGPPQNALNNKIDSVINKYGAFLNQVEAFGNSGALTEFRYALLRQDAQDVIDTLEDAKKAG
jgi:hypothetical protein